MLLFGARDPWRARVHRPKGLMLRHLLAIAVILTVAPGCDNVKFGGASLEILPPPSTGEGVEIDVDDGDVVSVLNEDLPILLAGVRDGSRATLTLVGEVHGDVLRAFPDSAFPSDTERLEALTALGSEWILFSEGVRVGRLVVDAADIVDGFCGPRARVSGIVELVPAAAGAERLLALPADDARERAYGEYHELGDVYEQRVATLQIAQEAIPEQGARWPLSILDARKHIQAFDLGGAVGPYVAATFMYEDELAVSPPGQGAYALFVMGEQVGDIHERAYVWYRAVDTEGKGAPRYFDHLDWDGDGVEEILLDVFGSNRRWFAGLAQVDGSWVRTFQDVCGAGSTSSG